MSDHRKIEQEAAEWLARMDRGLNSQEQAAFDLWLNRATAHRVSYLRLRACWMNSGDLIRAAMPAAELRPRRQRAS